MNNLRVYLIRLFCLVCVVMSSTAKGQVVANFVADHQAGCAPLITHFTNTSTGAVSYSWNLGNNATSLQTDPSTSYLSPGTYTVILTATASNGATSTKTLTITVYGVPQVNFTAPTTVCAGAAISFNNQTNAGVPGPVTYSWNFGDGGTSTSQNPSHTYVSAGSYNVSLLATNSQGCDSLLIKTAFITVLPLPTSSFTANNTHFCNAPVTATFTGQATGNGPYTYAWTFGDNGTAAGGTPTHNYLSNGTYTVSLTVTDVNGCQNTDTQPAYITVGGPHASFTPPVGCAGFPVTLTSNSTPAGVGAYWDFGDATTGAGGSTTHTYAVAGTYMVKLVANDGTCLDTVILPVVINPNPVASFTFTPSQPCSAPATISFTSTAPAGSSYAWSFSDGGTNGTANPTHTFSSYGIDTATLVVTNNNGCQTTIKQLVGIYDLYASISAPIIQGCIPLNTSFMAYDSTTIYGAGNYPYPVTSYVWHFGDGTPTSNQASTTHTYTSGGNYTAYVTLTTSNGCTATDSVHIATAPIPPVTITVSTTHICNDRIVTFHATPTNGALYMWHYGDHSLPVGAINDSMVSHQYVSPGVDTPYVVVSVNGCQDTVKAFNILITIDTPKSIFNPEYRCDTLTKVFFLNMSLGATTSTWLFGDGNTSTDTNPVHIFPSLGTYTTQLITYNATTGCRDTLQLPVILHSTQSSFTANDTAVCVGTNVTSTAVYTGGPVNIYNWYVDGSTVSGANTYTMTDSFYIKGRHSIELITEDDHQCYDTAIRNNYILVAKPVDSFYFSPVTGCTPLTVKFIDSSKDVPGAYVVSHSWFYFDGGTSPNTGASVTHTYNTGGVYFPMETIIDNLGCVDTLTSPTPVTVTKPTASFTATTLFPCKYIPMSFNNNSVNAVTNYWTFGDNTNSSLVAPPHTYTQNGGYTVTLTVTDTHGCKDSMIRNAYLNVGNPTAGFNLSDSVSICSPLIENFTNTSVNAVSYQWLFGNNSSSALLNPSTPYSTPGIYNVMLIATDAHGCNDTATKHLKVYGYSGEITYTPITGCSPLTVNFIANITNVPHITWDFSDGNVSATSSSVTATHTYTSPGAYVPKLIISDSTGCSASTVGKDTIRVDGIVGGFTTFPYPVCIYDTVKFLDTSKSYFTPIISRTWTFNNTTVNNLTSPLYYFNNANNLSVNLVVVNTNGCRDTVSGSVAVHPLPAITASTDTVICLHDAAKLTAGGAVSYVWSPAANVSCDTCATTAVAPLITTTFLVKGKDAFGCVNTDSTHVRLKTKTTDIVGAGGEICNKQSLALSDSGAQTYSWFPATGLSNSTIGNPIASPSSSTNYMVVAYQGSCIPDTNYVNVIVHPLPVVKATAGESTIIAGGSTDLLASGANIISFLWEPGDLLNCDSCSRALAKLQETTTFTVIGKTQFGCEDSDKVRVQVLCDKSQLFIPNTFTPNGDGQNDVFYPRGVGLKIINSFRIYNRWGEMIFERKGIQLNDDSNAWDGTISGGKPLPDVYVYVVDGICDNGSPISWKGDVTLIR